MGKWSELHFEVLVLVVRKLQMFEDFKAFRRVCKSWSLVGRQDYMTSYLSNREDQIPWLMLPPEKGSKLRGFLNVSRGFIHQLVLPEANGKKCLSSKGWLLTVGQDWSIHLLHPLTRAKVKLPGIKAFPDWKHQTSIKLYATFIMKVVLSSTPTSSKNLGSSRDDYVVLVIYGDLRRLAFWRPGDKNWIVDVNTKLHFFDIIDYKGKFYAVGYEGEVYTCSLSNTDSNPQILVERVATLPRQLVKLVRGWFFIENLYLVESVQGSLLMVSRTGQQGQDVGPTHWTYGTDGFQVFKVPLHDNEDWEEVKDLGETALFIGYSSSFSVKASKFSGCKPNCIYFSDDYFESYWFMPNGGGKDTGIYSMADQTIQTFLDAKHRNNISPRTWVVVSS